MEFNKILIGISEGRLRNSYYLTERSTDMGTVFGVTVQNDETENSIDGLFEDREEAEFFVRMLLKNDVSPIHLFAAADDHIGRLCFEQ